MPEGRAWIINERLLATALAMLPALYRVFVWLGRSTTSADLTIPWHDIALMHAGHQGHKIIVATLRSNALTTTLQGTIISLHFLFRMEVHTESSIGKTVSQVISRGMRITRYQVKEENRDQICQIPHQSNSPTPPTYLSFQLEIKNQATFYD